MPNAAKKFAPPVSEGLLPIRTVSTLTGVNAVTIRAWERRYGLITPQRTPKGHRLYTEQDVQRINAIVELLDQGISVGQVKPLLDQTSSVRFSATSTDNTDIWQHYQDQMLRAIEVFDEPLLDSIYNDALSLYPIDVINQRLTTPLLERLGERWKSQATGVAQEHFFSVYLRNKLGTRIHHITQRGQGPMLLLACLPGEFHEIGLLFFALAAANLGYRILVLGANTPLDQLPAVLEQRPCAGVVLAGASKPARGVLDNELAALVKHMRVPVFVGGNAVIENQNKIEASGAICLEESISSSLQLIKQTLKK